MKKAFKKIFMIVIFCILVCSYSSAYSGKIYAQIELKDSFKVGDVISFSYTLLSEESIEVVYIPGINCPNAPIRPIFEKTVKLEGNKSFSERFDERIVDEHLEPQKCEAYIWIKSPIKMTEKTEFLIETNPSFSFNLNSCKDQSCSEKSKIFVKNEEIFLNYDSEVSELIITNALTYPDQTTQEIKLPTIIKAEQTGTYELKATALKKGYRPITETMQFSVIEENVIILDIQECSLNYICENNENYGTCPNDCSSGGRDNFCDKVNDGICDPDCNHEEDLDCPKEEIKKVINKTKEETGQSEKAGKESKEPVKKEEGRESKYIISLMIVLILIAIALFLIISFKNKNLQ